jgi:hypothetical protein
MLSAGHLAGGLALVRRKVATARDRETDDYEWWERGGHDEGEEEPAEEASGVSLQPSSLRGKAPRTAVSSGPTPPKLPDCWQHELPVSIDDAEGVRCKGAFLPAQEGNMMEWFDGVVMEAIDEGRDQYRLMCFFTSDDYLEEWPLRKGERDPLLCFPNKGGSGGTLRVSRARLDQLKEQAAEAAEASEE